MQEAKGRNKAMVAVSYEDIINAMWQAYVAASGARDDASGKLERKLKAQWRRLFKKHHLMPRRYLAVIQVGRSHWLVESESRPEQMHSLESHDGQIVCTCEDMTIRKHPCKHAILIKRLINENIMSE